MPHGERQPLSARLRSWQAHNLSTFRHHALSEISGSLGDLGTLLPLLISLTLTRSINLPATLVFTGVANIATGLWFHIPLPVQPMKAIAAIAIARQFTVEETASAGLFVSAVVGVLSATRMLDWVGRTVPIPVVKGIQVGAGLNLVISAGSSLLVPLGWLGHFRNEDNWILALLAFLGLLATSAAVRSASHPPRVPYALIIFIVGLAFAGLHLTRSGAPKLFDWWHPTIIHPTGKDFVTGAVDAGLGQLPLTILNSIIAVTHLSAELLPSQPVPTPISLGMSILVMNGIGCAFGAMPACHGSGGLAGQYRFGARSGSSVILLGLFKLVVGLLFSERWLIEMLERFPKALLGILVIAAGVELAKVGESLNTGARDLWEEAAEENGGRKARVVGDQERADRWMVMMVTVAGLLAFKNDAVGFVAGLVWHMGLHAPAWWASRQQRREQHTAEEGTSLLSG